MKHSKYVLMVVSAGFSACAMPAAAELTGVEVDVINQGNGLVSHQVFVVFDDLRDRLLGVAGTPTLDMLIQTDDPSGFFQVAGAKLGSDIAPPQALTDLFPELFQDSYVSVGLQAGHTSADAILLTPGWFTEGVSDDFNNNGQIGPTDEGWVNSSPDNGQGDAIGDGRVFIGQFTVGQGFVVEGIDMTVGWIDTSDPDGGTILTAVSFFSVPAPGVMGFLTLAGLVAVPGRRRLR